MKSPIYQQIHEIIRLIPVGKVATYGQIADIVGGCTARMVGYAASAIPFDSDIPWQRVINYQGGISTRSGGSGELLQQELLEAEGIQFDQNGRTNLELYRWKGECLQSGLSTCFCGFKSQFEECPWFQVFSNVPLSKLQGGGSEDQYFHS